MRVEDELVAEEWSCPRCGERRMDWLEVQEDDSIECATCGQRYELPEGGEVEEE